MLGSVGKHISLSQGSRNCNRHLSLKNALLKHHLSLSYRDTCLPLPLEPISNPENPPLFIGSNFNNSFSLRVDWGRGAAAAAHLHTRLTRICFEPCPCNMTVFFPSSLFSRPGIRRVPQQWFGSRTLWCEALHSCTNWSGRSPLSPPVKLVSSGNVFFFFRPSREQGSRCLQYVASAMT